MRAKPLLAPTSMGSANRARLLELLHGRGPSSRAELARHLGVSRATVASITQPLLDDGLLVEQAARPSSSMGGKPGRPIWFSTDGHRLGAVRISPDEITAACMMIDGELTSRAARTLRADTSTADVRRAILQTTGECFEGSALLGIGVAASGMVDVDHGTILSVHLAPALNGLRVTEILSDRFGVPAYIDHHPRVQALGDKWFGAGRGRTSFASVYTGEALGFGVVHNGEIIRGEHGAGGESGHTVVDMTGQVCMCGRRGCWETVATLRWLRARATTLGLNRAEAIDCHELVAQARQGEPRAESLLDEYARNLAIGMANNDQVLASGTYIIHGDAVGGGAAMRARLQHWTQQFSPHRDPRPTIVFAETPDDITLLGGGGLVLSSLLDTRV